MPGVFATSQTFAGGFRADLLDMMIAGIPTKGMILQNVQYTYNQQVNMLYELGSDYVYFVGGHAQGNCSIQHIAGPSAIVATLLSLFRDLCTPQTLSLTATAGCGGANSGMHVELEDAVLIGVGGSVSVQDMMINRSLQLMFVNMQTDAGGDGSNLTGAILGGADGAQVADASTDNLVQNDGGGALNA